jgi:peptidyl-dipeptidase A
VPIPGQAGIGKAADLCQTAVILKGGDMRLLALAALVLTLLDGCGNSKPQPKVPETPVKVEPVKKEPPKPTAGDAEAFLKTLETDLLKLYIARERASWVKSTYITSDTEALSALADEAVMEYVGRKAAEATKFDKVELPAELRRKLDLLKLQLSLPAPKDAQKRAELARISNGMEGTYGKGKYCSDTLATSKWRKKDAKGNCLSIIEITEGMAKSRDADELLDLWQGWHTIAPPMRKDFEKFVSLGNEGARDLGFKDLGDLWKSRYDMKSEEFEKEVDRLWEQLKPLYQDLHCYVRSKLSTKYGAAKVPETGPIPAHLLGNIWAQEWGNLYDLLAPKKDKAPSLDKELAKKKVDEQGMVKYGEAFFVSLGLTKLPESFWERSMFRKPQDREVVCHASAWDVDWDSDLRIKMCIKINEDDFTTIHHELGHNYYQYYYRNLPTLFRDSANDGFHEALGDTIALSVTPSYLQKLDLLKKVPDDALNPLMARALEKIAFLPFGVVIDKWRWDVFSGKIKPGEYNKSWWELRKRYQGVAPASDRGEDFFDPGAKYHVPANVPYTRYFLAAVLQFQFHRALCKLIKHDGPLHTCSIYENKDAGKKIAEMMEMGQSKPWPEALKVITGDKKMDASAITEYFEPLHTWLKEQNKGKTCGW